MAVAFDAVSAGIVQTGLGDGTNSTAQITIASNATAVVLFIEASLEGGNNDSSFIDAFSVLTIGGQALTRQTNAIRHSGDDRSVPGDDGGGTSGFVDLYAGLTTVGGGSIPTGTQTLSITPNHGVGGSVTDMIARIISVTGTLDATPFSTPVRSGGHFVSSVTLAFANTGANDLVVGCCCNGTASPGVTTGTSISTDTGGTATASHGGLRVARNTGTGTVNLVFSTNSGDNSGATGLRIVAGGGTPLLVVQDLTVATSIGGPLTLNVPGVQVRGWAAATNTTDALPAKPITLPTRVAGDLLICFCAGDFTSAITPTGSWTELSDEAGSANRLAVYARIATNDANDALSLAGANNADFSANVVAITVDTHAVTNVATDIICSAAASTGATGNADPPSQDGGSARDWLAFAACAVDVTGAGQTPTAYPGSYSAGVLQESGNIAGSVALGVGQRQLWATQTENPGTFTNTSNPWVAKTVLVPPHIGVVSLTVDDLSVATSIDNVALTQHNVLVVGDLGVATAIDNITFGQPVLYPASVSGRKWLDQNDDVYLLKACSSWSLAENLTNAEMDDFLDALVALGFNAVTVSLPGHRGPNGTGWNWQTNQAGDPYWTTTGSNDQWNTALGSGWASYDHLLAKASELAMVVILSFYTGASDGSGSPPTGNEGIGPVLEWQYTRLGGATYLATLEDIGEAIATRFADFPNIIWHLGADKNWAYGIDLSFCIDALFHGIANIEGASPRFRIGEPDNAAIIGESALTRWDDDFTWFTPLSADSVYSYDSDQVNVWNDIYIGLGFTVPVWDCEPPYVENSQAYNGSPNRQKLRERPYATFLRNGVGLNWGHESIYGFDQGSWWGGLTLAQALASAEISDASHAWSLFDACCADPTWTHDTGTFLTTGLGTGNSTAASGHSDTVAIVYFPNSRTIVVDTTILTGTGNVRLRWYDPTTGTFVETIADSEAQNASRSITYKSGSHSDTYTDWVLVVDLVGGGDATATPSTVARTVSVPSATETASANTSPTTIALTDSLSAPTTTGAANAAPSVIARVAVTPSPIETASANTAPAVIALVAVTPAATATAGVTTSPSVVVLSAATPAPTVTAAANASTTVIARTAVTPSPTEAASANTAPAVIALAAVTPAATATSGVSTSPSVVALSATTSAPTVTAAANTSTTVIASTVVTPAPTFSVSANATPAVVALAAVTPAPTSINLSANPTPATIARVVVTPAPTETASGTTTPTTIALSVVTPAATGSVAVTATPTVVTLAAATPAPITTGGANTAPSVIALAVITPAPTVITAGEGTATPNLIVLSVATPAPAITLSASPTPSVIARSVITPSPTLTAGGSASPTVINRIAVTPAPVLTAGASSAPSSIQRSVVVPATTASGGGGAATSVVARSVVIPAPTFTAGANTSPSVVALVAVTPAPSVITGGAATATPVVISQAVVTPAPTASGGASGQPSVIARTASLPSPTIHASSAAQPPTMALVVLLPSPVPQAAARTTPTSVALVITTPAPSAQGGVGVTPSLITTTVTLTSPVGAGSGNALPAELLYLVQVYDVVAVARPPFRTRMYINGEWKRVPVWRWDGTQWVTDDKAKVFTGSQWIPFNS